MPRTLDAEEIHTMSGFVHRLHRPEQPNGETVVLLHGSGGDEATLLPFAAQVAPSALLLGARGRILQEGVTRWYRRITPVRFDQQDIRGEAEAFAGFLLQASAAYKLDLACTTFLAYSNGANLVAAMALLHPGAVRRAVLMRSMPVLDKAPAADLAGARFLILTGKDDRLYARYAPALEKVLRKCRADVDGHIVQSGHEFGDEDARIAREWLAAAPEVSMKQE